MNMVQATDDDATTANNVHPFPSAGGEPQPRPRRRGKDRRAAARQAKRRSNIKLDRDTGTVTGALVHAPLIAPVATQAERDSVTLPAPPEWRAMAPKQTVERAPRYASLPLAVIAYGFFALGLGINIWNAWTGGPIVNVILPAAMGVLTESVMFFLPERTISLPLIGKLLAWVFLAFVAAFALTNSLRMANIVSAHQAAARADGQTQGLRTADQALEAARAKRDEACGRGLGKTVACQSRPAEVAQLEAKQTQATNKVAADAKPEGADFAKLVAWLSNGALQ